MIGSIVGEVCETLTRHRMGPWTQMGETGIDSHFNHSQCRWCRQWYVRPRPLKDIDWLREALEIQSRPQDTLQVGPKDPWRITDRR